MNNHALGSLQSLQLGEVTDNQDPDSRGRIKVRLLAAPMELWASVIAPSAGNGYGTAFIPRLNEIVVLAFVTPEMPLVLGSVWAGSSSTPQEASDPEKNYVIRTPANTVMDFNDDSSSGPKVQIKTQSGYNITINESNGGEILIERSDQSVKLSSSGIDITSSGQVHIQASTVTVDASMVTVNASMSKFSGVVQCDTIIATAVVGSSYTPGAGNIW